MPGQRLDTRYGRFTPGILFRSVLFSSLFSLFCPFVVIFSFTFSSIPCLCLLFASLLPLIRPYLFPSPVTGPGSCPVTGI
jgi:hypothetical protein